MCCYFQPPPKQFDVDAINLTLSRMSVAELSAEVAVLSIVIASFSNTLQGVAGGIRG